MSKKADAPPAPDYGPLIAASSAAAKDNLALSKDQFDWAKKTYAENKETNDKVVANFLDTSTENQANARKDRARYEGIYQPLEDDLAKEATDYASPERKDLEVGRSQARVAQAFDSQRQAAARDLEAFGVNPGATRFGALDTTVRAQKGAAMAAAGSQASQMVDATGRALRSEAINVGRGYPGQIAGTTGTGLAAGTGAVNTGLSTTASGANTMGTGAQWASLSQQGLNSAGNLMHTGYEDNLAQFKADQASSSGYGAIAGALTGAASKAFLGPTMPWVFAAEGGAIDTTATPGGRVPITASPSRGGMEDDVDAKLTVGEMVIPRDVTAWKGEEFFQKLIASSREKKGEAGAKPTVAMGAPPGPPTFQSRPGGAIPTGPR